MSRKITSLLLFLFLSMSLFSNNLNLGSTVNVDLVSLTESEVTLNVSIKWENSWRDSYNNDAVWIFFKYRTTSKPQWKHVMLKDAGVTGNGYTSLGGSSSTSIVGTFVYRSSISSGESSTELTVKWNYAGSGVTRQMFEQQEVFLMAQGIEMVYVPFGPFTVGDVSSTNSLRDGNGNPFIVGPSLGSIKDGSASYSLRPTFPTGYSGFYVMKYEVSQEQYMAFLNTLSLSEQKNLLGDRVASLKKGDYIFGSVSSPSKRNGIIVSQPSKGTESIVFDNNYTQDDKYGEPDDGRTLACNYMSVNDLLGYSSWAGLRPMTEMEYEKACRRLSPMSVVPGEYAWGTTDIELLTGIAEGSGGTPSERPNGGYANAERSEGPIRCGAFSFISSDRVSAGAGFSGVMEMSGNVKELCAHVNMGPIPFKHGEGAFAPSLWTTPARGYYGVRGGGFSSRREQLRVSDRSEMSGDYITSPALRDSTVGFRSVRMLNASDFTVNPGQIRISGSSVGSTPVVCSGVPFSIESVSLASVAQLSGVTFRYEWYKNGQLLPDAKGASLNYPTGIFNTEASDQSFTFTRKAISYIGEGETDEIIVTVPGRLKIIGGSVYTLECGNCIPAGATAKLTGNGLFCWKNGTDHTIVKAWTSSGSLLDQYIPNHTDFGYAPSEKELWCLSNQNGCIDSIKVTVKVQNSCSPSLSSRSISMSTSTNAESVTATLCGSGVVSWYYKDGSADGKLLKTETGISSTYKPVYADFNNEVGEMTVICRASTGTGVGSCKSVDQEIKVNVSATLDPGAITCSQYLLCGGSKITVGESRSAGVPGMNLSDITYEWYHNDVEKITGQAGASLNNYTLPANSTNALVRHRFHRIAKSVKIAQTSQASNVIEVSVPGVPTVNALSSPGAVCADGNLVLTEPVVNAAGGTVSSRTWKLDGLSLPAPYTVSADKNGKTLTYTVETQCAAATSNGVAISVNARPSAASVTGSKSVCAGNTSADLKIYVTGGTSPYNYTLSNVGSFSAKTSGTTHTVRPSGTTSYALSAVTDKNGCTLSGVPVAATITVNALPAVPSVTGGSRCGSGTVVLSASSSGAVIDWYSASSGGSAFATGNSWTTGSLGVNTTYYTEARNTTTGCISASRSAVTATVNAIPSVVSVSGNSRCGVGTVALSAVPSSGAVIEWYSTSSGGSAFATGNSWTTGSLGANTTYYVGAKINSTGCLSTSRTGVRASVTVPNITNAGTLNVTVGSGGTCGQVYLNGNVGASVDCGSINYEWYEGGTRLATSVNGGTLTGVSAGSHTYMRRAIAASNTGSYRDVSQTVTVASCGAVDGDGNTYKMVTIGNQVWTSENLKYRYGTYVEGQPTSTFGYLYDWSTATTICSKLGTGWRLPSNADWTALANSLGGASVAGGKMKQAGTSLWEEPNVADNSSGWTGLPGGRYSGSYDDKGSFGLWWSSEENKYYYMNSPSASLYGPYTGYTIYRQSVRCVKDK